MTIKSSIDLAEAEDELFWATRAANKAKEAGNRARCNLAAARSSSCPVTAKEMTRLVADVKLRESTAQKADEYEETIRETVFTTRDEVEG